MKTALLLEGGKQLRREEWSSGSAGGLRLHTPNSQCQRGGCGQMAALKGNRQYPLGPRRLTLPSSTSQAPTLCRGIWPLGFSERHDSSGLQEHRQVLGRFPGGGLVRHSRKNCISMWWKRTGEAWLPVPQVFPLETSLVPQVLKEELDNREGIFNPTLFYSQEFSVGSRIPERPQILSVHQGRTGERKDRRI